MGGNAVAARERQCSATGHLFAMLRAPDAEPPLSTLTRHRPPQPPAGPIPLPVPVDAQPPPDTGEAARALHPDAHRFVLSTLRPVFEVLDRRRPAKHLSTIATGTVVDVLRTLAAARAEPSVSAWGEVHVAQPRALPARRRPRPDDPHVGAEIFLTYTRGGRVLAAAGRVESTHGRWRWVAFTTAA